MTSHAWPGTSGSSEAPAEPNPSARQSRRGSDFAGLSREIREAGLLERRPGYYTVLILGTLALFGVGLVFFFLLGDSWYQLAVAVFFGVVFTHLAFIGHDVGHRQVFRTRRASEIAGYLHGNLLVGLSQGWWLDKHNRHHSNPNKEDHDPDIGSGALAFTDAGARARSGFGRVLLRWQAYLFFPMLLLEGLNLHFAGVRALPERPPRRRAIEAVLLLVHFAGYLAALFLVLSPLKAVVFLAVHQGLFGLYMGCAFAPNHKGMPILSRDDEQDFLRRQVLTSRNVRGGRLVTFALGGLDYQIEHHLFPSMSRPNLRRAQPIVHAYCRRHAIAYQEAGLVRSYALALGHLNEVGTTGSDVGGGARPGGRAADVTSSS